jgi:hypothetical protein
VLRERRIRRTRLDQGKRPIPLGHAGARFRCSACVRLSVCVQTVDQTGQGRRFDASGGPTRPGERRHSPKWPTFSPLGAERGGSRANTALETSPRRQRPHCEADPGCSSRPAPFTASTVRRHRPEWSATGWTSGARRAHLRVLPTLPHSEELPAPAWTPRLHSPDQRPARTRWSGPSTLNLCLATSSEHRGGGPSPSRRTSVPTTGSPTVTRRRVERTARLRERHTGPFVSESVDTPPPGG